MPCTPIAFAIVAKFISAKLLLIVRPGLEAGPWVSLEQMPIARPDVKISAMRRYRIISSGTALRRAGIVALIVVMAVPLAIRPAHTQDATVPPPAESNVFQQFVRTTLERGLMLPILTLFREKQYAKAEQALRKVLEKLPRSPLFHYNLAAAQARLGKTDAALENLTLAIDYGFENRQALQGDPDLASVRGHARFKALVAELDADLAARTATPAPVPVSPFRVTQGRAYVSEGNTDWSAHGNILRARFSFEPKPAKDKVMTGDDPVARSLNQWFGEGRAAGNHGDLYDNRDRGHSRLSGQFQQIARIEYSAAARGAGVDYGANTGLFFNAITFGNSSTALTSSFAWRSQARLVLSNPELTGRAAMQYVNNQLYVYPEHLDHDPHNGDLMPANTPYILISQGSSGSDQPFLKAVGAILAAFRP